jgi:hypothetical protein
VRSSVLAWDQRHIPSTSSPIAKIKNRTKSSGIIRNEAVRPGTGSPIRRITP